MANSFFDRSLVKKPTPKEDAWLQYKGEPVTMDSVMGGIKDIFWFDTDPSNDLENVTGKRPERSAPTVNPEELAGPPRTQYREQPAKQKTPEQETQESVFDALFTGHSVRDYQPTGIASTLKVPDANKYRKESTTNLKQFAKDLGVNLKDPYDTWSYIRDMSAGLLASDDPTYLGALGDAALLSNKNRATANAAQKELKAKLALAKYKGDQAWDIARYKADMTLAGKLADEMGGQKVVIGGQLGKVTDDNGVTHEVMQIKEGADFLASQPDSKVFSFDGQPAIYRSDADQYKLAIEVRDQHQKQTEGIVATMTKPKVYDKMLKEEMRKHMYKGNQVWGAAKDDRYLDALEKLRDAGVEGIDQFAEAVEEGRGQDAYYFMQSTTGAPALMKGLKSAMEEGLYTSLTEGEQGKLDRIVEEEAIRLAKEAVAEDFRSAKNPNDFIRQAMENIIPDINWDIEGDGKFRVSITEREYEKGLEKTGDIVGLDLVGSIFNLDIIDTSEFPPDDPRSGAVLQLSDEINAFNKNQYSLLSPHDQGLLNADVPDFARQIAQATGIGTDKAMNDLWSDMLTRDVVGGGEDVFGGTNQQAKYRPYSTWKVEPGKRRQQARDNGFLWDSQGGVWWKPGTDIIKEPESKPDEIKLKR